MSGGSAWLQSQIQWVLDGERCGNGATHSHGGKAQHKCGPAEECVDGAQGCSLRFRHLGKEVGSQPNHILHRQRLESGPFKICNQQGIYLAINGV